MSKFDDFLREKELGLSNFERKFWVEELKKQFPSKWDLRGSKDNNIFYESDKEKVSKYFFEKIPSDKIKIEYNFLKDKYLLFTITINLDKDFDFICEYTIDDKYNTLIKRVNIGLSKLKHHEYISNFNLDYLKIETIFDEIVEFYHNYSKLVYLLEEKKLTKEKKEKLITINKVSVENLAALYFDNYELEIDVEHIKLTLKYLDNVEISYRIKTDNFAATFSLIKEKSDMLKTNLIELSNCNHYYIEKLNLNKNTHNTLVAPEKIKELLSSKEELENDIKSFLKNTFEERKEIALINNELSFFYDYLKYKSIVTHYIDYTNAYYKELEFIFHAIFDSERILIENEYKEAIFKYTDVCLDKYCGVKRITKKNINDFFEQYELYIPTCIKDLFWSNVNEELEKRIKL